jgi:hypothetical protein
MKALGKWIGIVFAWALVTILLELLFIALIPVIVLLIPWYFALRLVCAYEEVNKK